MFVGGLDGSVCMWGWRGGGVGWGGGARFPLTHQHLINQY